MNASDLSLLKDLEKNPIECSVVDVIKNNSDAIVSIKCKCGKYHPVLMETLRWGDEISKEVLSEILDRSITYGRLLAEQW